MSIVMLRADIELNDSVPSIALIKQDIATDIAEMNLHAAKGALNSYEMAKHRLNKKVDNYIKMRTLTLVRN